MHIVELSVSDTRLAAAIAQAPLTDGLAAAVICSVCTGGGRLLAVLKTFRRQDLVKRPSRPKSS